jgi:hypothetical protein
MLKMKVGPPHAVRAMAILAMPVRAMAILAMPVRAMAMPGHGQDARGT